jgi:hypothetical protein
MFVKIFNIVKFIVYLLNNKQNNPQGKQHSIVLEKQSHNISQHDFLSSIFCSEGIIDGSSEGLINGCSKLILSIC